MNPATIQIHKTVGIEPGQTPIYILRMSVTSAVNITPCIFVTKYQPGSKYTGQETYTFWNVAYLDELTSISDTVGNRRASCFVRRSCLEYRCASEEDLHDFINTVSSGIQRLLRSVRTLDNVDTCSTLNIGEDTIIESTCVSDTSECADSSDSSDAEQSSISLSFTGE